VEPEDESICEAIFHRLQKIESKLASISAKQDALLLHLGITQMPLLKPEVIRKILELIENER